MKKFVVSALILSGLAGFGCAQKTAVAPQDTQAQAAKADAKKGEESQKAPEKITEQHLAKVEAKDAASASAGTEELAAIFKDIHFDFDKYDIRDDAKPALKAIAEHMTKNSGQKILIEGHCDERGTNEYNLGLGDRRAKATKDYLVASGVLSSRIDVISYGEEKPLCTEQKEECWGKNRRSHFAPLKGNN